MKILFDTNILISNFFLKSRLVTEKLAAIVAINDCYICDYSINEFAIKIFTKFSKTKEDLSKNIEKASTLMFDNKMYILLTSSKNDCIYKTRDPKDDPILNTAINNKMDLLITSDNDLLKYQTNKIKIQKLSDVLIHSVWSN
ncbi:MAG: putative toxin-antitoxin system toxin component, PIN family [Mycoplasmataceae bacterium]|jgi:putative PIN family toxin of toxin-antitoxin system|nr:putative toxin-antitoxin system toxin component, PIN family [Mycoplasmataceae bacterium]